MQVKCQGESGDTSSNRNDHKVQVKTEECVQTGSGNGKWVMYLPEGREEGGTTANRNSDAGQVQTGSVPNKSKQQEEAGI